MLAAAVARYGCCMQKMRPDLAETFKFIQNYVLNAYQSALSACHASCA
jgi:hypothetical protein